MGCHPTACAFWRRLSRREQRWLVHQAAILDEPHGGHDASSQCKYFVGGFSVLIASRSARILLSAVWIFLIIRSSSSRPERESELSRKRALDQKAPVEPFNNLIKFIKANTGRCLSIHDRTSCLGNQQMTTWFHAAVRPSPYSRRCHGFSNHTEPRLVSHAVLARQDALHNLNDCLMLSRLRRCSSSFGVRGGDIRKQVAGIFVADDLQLRQSKKKGLADAKGGHAVSFVEAYMYGHMMFLSDGNLP